MFDTVGPWNSRRWNPVLVSMLVGLLILTFGATSASLFGFDSGFPIVDVVVDVEGGEPCRNLCVRRPAGVVVPR